MILVVLSNLKVHIDCSTGPLKGFQSGVASVALCLPGCGLLAHSGEIFQCPCERHNYKKTPEENPVLLLPSTPVKRSITRQGQSHNRSALISINEDSSSWSQTTVECLSVTVIHFNRCNGSITPHEWRVICCWCFFISGLSFCRWLQWSSNIHCYWQLTTVNWT